MTRWTGCTRRSRRRRRRPGRSASSIPGCRRPRSCRSAAPRAFRCTRKCSSGSASVRASSGSRRWRPSAEPAVDLTGRAALVTGGSGDLGRAIAIALAEAGADVAVTWVGYREGASETCRQVEKRGRRTAMIQLDQSDPAAIAPAVDEAAAALGRLDVLVNNAGWNAGVPFRDLEGMTVDLWDRINDVNLRGPSL